MRRSEQDETRSRRQPGARRRSSNFKRRFTAGHLRRRRRDLLLERRTPKLDSSDIVGVVVDHPAVARFELIVSGSLQAEE